MKTLTLRVLEFFAAIIGLWFTVIAGACIWVMQHDNVWNALFTTSVIVVACLAVTAFAIAGLKALNESIREANNE